MVIKLKTKFLAMVKEFFSMISAFLDGRGWVSFAVGSFLFLLVQTFTRLEVLASTIGLILIDIGLTIIAKRIILSNYKLKVMLKKASDENNVALAIQNFAVIILLSVIIYVTAIFLNS